MRNGKDDGRHRTNQQGGEEKRWRVDVEEGRVDRKKGGGGVLLVAASGRQLFPRMMLELPPDSWGKLRFTGRSCLLADTGNNLGRT